MRSLVKIAFHTIFFAIFLKSVRFNRKVNGVIFKLAVLILKVLFRL